MISELATGARLRQEKGGGECVCLLLDQKIGHKLDPRGMTGNLTALKATPVVIQKIVTELVAQCKPSSCGCW